MLFVCFCYFSGGTGITFMSGECICVCECVWVSMLTCLRPLCRSFDEMPWFSSHSTTTPLATCHFFFFWVVFFVCFFCCGCMWTSWLWASRWLCDGLPDGLSAWARAVFDPRPMTSGTALFFEGFSARLVGRDFSCTFASGVSIPDTGRVGDGYGPGSFRSVGAIWVSIEWSAHTTYAM